MRRFKKFKYNNEEIININEINDILDVDFEWFNFCEFEEAEISVKNKTIIWENGIFYNGKIHYIIWQNGIFKNGIFENGIWENGIFENGEFISGVWNDGEIKGGKNPNKK